MMAARGKTVKRGFKIQPTIPEGMRRIAQDLVGPIGRSIAPAGVDVNDVFRLMVLAGAVALKSCMRCNFGTPCEDHAETAMVGRLGVAELDTILEAKSEADGREHAALIDLYHRLFIEARGEKPKITTRDAGAFKRLRKTLGYEEAARVIRSAFADPRRRVTIIAIEADPSAFVGNLRPANRGASSTLQREAEALP